MQSNRFWYFLSELDLDVILFWMSTSTLQRLLQETSCPALQSRRAPREETAQPDERRDNPHTHSLFFAIYYTLLVGTKLTDSAGEVEERGHPKGGNLLGS